MAEIFYTLSSNLHRMARLEEGRVVELDFEIQSQKTCLLDGIFFGRVVEIQKPLHAAFVDIGEERLGMLPLREGTLLPVTKGEGVLVQVTRTENPLEDKGVRLTRLITLSLGPLLYTPFKPGLSLSKKLKNREAFKELFELKSEEGLIVRHRAQANESLSHMLTQLREEWEEIQRHSQKSPLRVSVPSSLLSRIVRGLSNTDTLHVDDRLVATQTKGAAIFSREKTFDERCEEAWESLSSSEVPIPKGGSLIIEETHGPVVIDINSQGAFRYTFNRDALQEILHQIRLRDLGGKIVVDLIGGPKIQEGLLQGLAVPSDLEIFGVSPMGLLEMIRRRKRLSLPQRLKLNLN